MTQSFQIRPYSLACDEGKQLRAFGSLVIVKAISEQADGAFNLFDVICPPGYSTSLHIHYAEDVAIYVLEGALAFFWGSKKKRLLQALTFFNPEACRMDFAWKAIHRRRSYT